MRAGIATGGAQWFTLSGGCGLVGSPLPGLPLAEIQGTSPEPDCQETSSKNKQIVCASRQGGDGLTVDTKGNRYRTRPSMKLIQAIAPDGKTLGLLRSPDELSNCTFGGADRPCHCEVHRQVRDGGGRHGKQTRGRTLPKCLQRCTPKHARRDTLCRFPQRIECRRAAVDHTHVTTPRLRPTDRRPALPAAVPEDRVTGDG